MVKEELSRAVQGTEALSDGRTGCDYSVAAVMLENVPGSETDCCGFRQKMRQLQEKALHYYRKTFNIETAIVIREGSHLKRGRVYLVEVTDPARAEEVLQGTKLSVDNKTEVYLKWIIRL